MKNHPKSTGTNFLFAIAIEEYTHLANAPLAVQKVETLIKVLQTKYQVEADHTTLLANGEATLENIFQHFEKLINQLTGDDRLFIIFSGWGDSKKLFNQSYWIPVNAQEGKTHQYLASSELISTVQSFKARQILVLSDTLYFPVVFTPYNAEINYTDITDTTIGHWLLASGASIQNGIFSESHFIEFFTNTLLENPGEYLLSELVEKLKTKLSPDHQSSLIFGHLNGVPASQVAQFQLTPKLNEAAEWAICKQENDLIAYNLFLQKYGEGEFAAEARERLHALQEDLDWEKAVESNTVNGYLDYKKKYRNGKYSADADEKIALASLASFGRETADEEKTSTPTAPKDNPNQPSDYTRTPTRLAPKSFISGRPPANEALPPKKKEKKNLLIPILAIALLGIACIGLFFKYGKKQAVEILPKMEEERSDSPEENNVEISSLEELPGENLSNDNQTDPDADPETPSSETLAESTLPPPAGQTAAELLVKAQQARDQKKYRDAVTYANQALSLEPGNSQATNLLEESQKLFDQESYQQRLNTGNRLLEQKKYSEAIGYFQRALKYQPGDETAMAQITKAEELMKNSSDNSVDNTESIPAESTTSSVSSSGLPEAIIQLDKSMAYVKGGSFMRGNDNGEEDEKPAVTRNVASFYMCKYEVTQELYQAIMGNNPSTRKCPNCPVSNVSWSEANTFIKNLNSLTKKRYRLPTEDEWEFAAKGGTLAHTYNYAGGNNINSVGWYNGNAQGKVQPVKQKSPTPQGIFDLTGNVAEWCYDPYDVKATEAPGTGIISGDIRSVRGGSYLDDDESCRVTNRQNMAQRFGKPHIGFRLVK